VSEGAHEPNEILVRTIDADVEDVRARPRNIMTRCGAVCSTRAHLAYSLPELSVDAQMNRSHFS
jgi:hypothetical protein